MSVGAQQELMRLGGWERFGEALHELTHAQESIAFVKAALGQGRQLSEETA